jgi:hypothetical protein
MTTTHQRNEKASESTDPRPNYIQLGQDEIGDVHLYRTTDESVFVIDHGGHLVERFNLNGRPLHHYREFIAAQRGWHDYWPTVQAEIEDPFALMRRSG